MIVVSDTSALSSLIDIDQIALLWKLYDEVIIPVGVRDELLKRHTPVPSGIVVRTCSDVPAVRQLAVHLGPGEAEAIILAKEIKANLLLIDERKGRAFASREGLPIIGVLGVLAAAKQKGLIPSLASVLDELIGTGFFVSPDLRRSILNRVGEKPS